MEKPIFCFTGKEISDELFNVLKKLISDIDVSVEEIESTPEFEMGKNMCEMGVETINRPKRAELRQNIIKEFLEKGSVSFKSNKANFDGEIKKERILDIVIGLPASGKSSAVVEILSNLRGAKVIDNDEVKKQIKEFNNGWGANIVHRESKLISAVILNKTLEEGANIILPKVGGYEIDIRNIIDEARKHNYKVNLHYVELNRNTAMARLLLRFIMEGRFLSPTLIYQDDNNITGNKIQQTYEHLIQDNYIDGYSRWNNNVKQFESPILVDFQNIEDSVLENILSGKAVKPYLSTLRNKEKIKNIVAGEMVLSKKISKYMQQNNILCKIDFENPEKMYLLLKLIKMNLYVKGMEQLNVLSLKKALDNQMISQPKIEEKNDTALDEILKQLSQINRDVLPNNENKSTER